MSARKKAPKARMGRPPLPEGTVKTIVFTLRVSEAERDAFAAAAARIGKPVTQWAREALVESAASR